jgi:hypothetical protein
MDVVSHVLDYPAPPLVTTWVDDILATDRLPCGGTVTVAVMCLTGFNQEDSLIASQGAIDRGMFRSTLFRTYRAEERTNGSEIERFERPDTETCLVLKSGNYETVGENGLVQPGQRLNNGDCIMGLTMNMSEMGAEGKRSVKRDRSVFMRTHETETVDAILEAQTPDGHKYVKVKTRCTRVPQVGDKFSCYTPDHELLTTRGWVGVADVVLGDLVATLDPDTGCVSYEPAQAVHVYPVQDEPLYEVETQQVSLKTTLNHNMYVKKRNAPDFALVPAENVYGKRVRFLKNCTDGLQANQCIAPVSSHLAPLPNGRLPEWCFHLTKAESIRALDGLMPLDGACRGYHAASLGLCDDVQRLALHCGWSADVSMDPQFADGQTNWQVRINRHKNSPENADEMVEPWTGNVHCVTVRTGIVYVRRNGKAVWCGNSRHGQKGVIGLILPDADLPFTQEGITPDLIVNCHALPSRMTLGHLVECLAGKLAAHHGVRSDGTPFRNVTVDGIGDALNDLGLSRTGNQPMTSGTTGELLNGEIFIGPTFYQRLKHMVADKRHARARGPYQITTRQPVEGRAREGGLRFGEMERDTLLSHGVAYFARDRLLEQSDSYVAPVCKKCGMLAEHACLSRALVHRARQAYCRNCDDHTSVVLMPMPYCLKLLLQELSVMGISTALKVDTK